MMTLEEKTSLIREAYEWQKTLYRASKQDQEQLKSRNRCAVYATGNNVNRMSDCTFASAINKYHPRIKIDVILRIKEKEVAQ